ncbi:MAG: iron dicitrate transport regulator FecR, partial [Pseudomonadota bacterium]
MTQHFLQGRSEKEVLWFQRRETLKAAAAWVAMGSFGAAVAQQRTNVVQQTGDALLNGSRLLPGQTIQTGDQLQTGPGSSLIFVMGNASFLVRQNTMMTVERGATLSAVSILRLVTGAVASIWNKGGSRSIITPTLTAGIRGTGVYTEVLPQQDNRTYFCNCYGTV